MGCHVNANGAIPGNQGGERTTLPDNKIQYTCCNDKELSYD